MIQLHLDDSNKIWKDKRIKPEGKIIYSYLHSKGFEGKITKLNVGELQAYVKISNKGLKNNLKALEFCEYLLYREYDTGMYTIKLLG